MYCFWLLVLCLKMDYMGFIIPSGKGVVGTRDVWREADWILDEPSSLYGLDGVCGAPSPHIQSLLNSLDLQDCDAQQLPLSLSFIVLNVLLSEFGYVVSVGLEKHSKHKINVSKHFSDAEEKYDFYWFLFRVSCIPGWPPLPYSQVWWNQWSSPLLARWDCGSAPSPSCMPGNHSTSWAQSLARQWLLGSCLKVHNHWPLSSALGRDKCVTTCVLHVGPERSFPNHFSRVMLCSQHLFVVLFLVFLLYL